MISVMILLLIVIGILTTDMKNKEFQQQHQQRINDTIYLYSDDFCEWVQYHGRHHRFARTLTVGAGIGRGREWQAGVNVCLHRKS